jgi:phage shock protein PspC (stress-responsive transcriptional regulator)
MVDVDIERPEGAAELWSRTRALLVRSTDDRVISGLAAGLSAEIGVGAAYVRATFVLLAMTGGVGIAFYALGWILSSGTRPTRDVERDLPGRKSAGLALMLLGAVFGLRAVGLWFGDTLVWSTGLVAFGIAAIWDRSERSDSVSGVFSSSSTRGRILLGALLMIGGLAIFAGSVESLRDLGPVVLAVAITAAGFMLVFGPWVLSLAGDLARERQDRIRSEERSEMAAHLHDSVLQTLALIQRADDPRKMTTLARTQERELRTWLYGQDRGVDGETLAQALETAATRIEQAHDVPIEVVVVNDVPTTGKMEVIVQATAEAMNNAARHSGANRVSVYAEVVNDMVDVFVTDQGSGFDPVDLPEDRHGVRESIIGRMERHGGRAEIESEPGEGTEIHLEMPMEAP